MISTLRYNPVSTYTAPRQEATQGRRCFHVKLVKKPRARSGFHKGIKRSGAAIFRKAVAKATWLVVRENALNTRT